MFILIRGWSTTAMITLNWSLIWVLTCLWVKKLRLGKMVIRNHFMIISKLILVWSLTGLILLVTLSKPSINKSITTTKEESILAWRCPRLNLDNDTTYAWSDRKTTPEKGHLTIIINNKSKINFLLIAGVHGDEIVGPMTILKALKEPKKNFNKKINYEIYPLLNPTGYELNLRNNNDNRDLNCINKITLKRR